MKGVCRTCIATHQKYNLNRATYQLHHGFVKVSGSGTIFYLEEISNCQLHFSRYWKTLTEYFFSKYT